MGGIVKYSTEMYSYVSSFGLGMNEDFWNKLPPDLKELVTKSMTGKEKEVGEAWDALDVPGKKALMDGGGEAIKLSPAENAKFRKIGAEVTEAKVKELEGKGMPARAVYDHDASRSPRSTPRPRRTSGTDAGACAGASVAGRLPNASGAP